MGKRGSVNLIIPKNDFNKKDFELVLKILKKHGGQYETSEVQKEIKKYYKDKESKTLDNTSIAHRLVAPRYLGFTCQDNDTCYLSEFGDYYINSTSKEDKIDCIYLAMSSITFGKNNPGTSSNSRVEAPNVFLKMLSDLGTATLKHFMVVLYLMEVKNLSYTAAINTVKDESKLSSLATEAESKGCAKFKDPKINIFFKEVGMVVERGGEYKLSDYVRDNYNLEDLSAVNEKTDEEEAPAVAAGPSTDDILKELITNQRTYEGNYHVSRFAQKSHMKTKNASDKIAYKMRGKSLSDSQCKVLGWVGEQYIKCLFDNIESEIRNKLGLAKDESIKESIWYNEGCTFDASWQDKSVGHGCDIEITTTKDRKLLVEVKSSLSNTPFFSTTGNELLTMAENKDNYFLIKVENVKALYDNKKPSIVVVKNPIKLLQNIYNIRDISFYL